jgi:hypothetical protein
VFSYARKQYRIGKLKGVMMSEYILPLTGEVIPEPDEIGGDGEWIWNGEEGTINPMTGEVSGPWSIMICPAVSGQPKRNTAWNRFWNRVARFVKRRVT